MKTLQNTNYFNGKVPKQLEQLIPKNGSQVLIILVGQAITASGLTVVVGFSALIFANFPIFKDFGITTVVDTLLSLICTLTILPALIYLFSRKRQS